MSDTKETTSIIVADRRSIRKPTWKSALPDESHVYTVPV
jgi:hypothetical protein